MEASLDEVEQARRLFAARGVSGRRAELGQFMTPARTARFMASLFADTGIPTGRLLDAGAGMGVLTAAFLERWREGGLHFDDVRVRAYEIDPSLRDRLEGTLIGYGHSLPLAADIVATDFIADAVARCLRGEREFTHAILNPPYKKINSDSVYRHLLRKVGIETVNLYSAFVALAVDLLAPGGQVVAILPRSFCNGPYYRPFRDFVVARAAIRHMHLFGSRTKAFQDDDVLQENVIIALERCAAQGDVTVSTSTDDTFADLATEVYPFERIVAPGDTERFIRIPTSRRAGVIERSPSVRFSLADIDVQVSTGPVVDFRCRPHTRMLPEAGTVPLLYPGHFGAGGVAWPRPDGKKPNAIARNAETERWLYPVGCYCVVRRFSSKEERRRLVASVVTPDAFPGAQMLGFENHLNVLHRRRNGLPIALAAGLAAYLNTTAVDDAFRRFNGHTQVNATDLRQMRYPSKNVLMSMGEWAMRQNGVDQAALDEHFERIIA